MNPHQKAIDSMFNDLDDIEQKKMFGEPDGDEKGVSITISVVPNGQGEKSSKDESMLPDEEPQGKEMNEGGVVAAAEPMPEDDDKTLPPFLRKKKRI